MLSDMQEYVPDLSEVRKLSKANGIFKWADHENLGVNSVAHIKIDKVQTSLINQTFSEARNYVSRLNYDKLKFLCQIHGLTMTGKAVVMKKRLFNFLEQIHASKNDHEFSAEEDKSFSLIKPFFKLKFNSTKRYLLVFDFEATCELNVQDYPHEIIEFPVFIFDCNLLKCIGIYHSFCAPILNQKLSTYCTQLTGISQKTVDLSPKFQDTLRDFENFLTQLNIGFDQITIVCDNPADMSKFMRLTCKINKIQFPKWAKEWCNISTGFLEYYVKKKTKFMNLNQMLAIVEYKFIGHKHQGIYDSFNILRIARMMLYDGFRFEPNQYLCPQCNPHYYSPIKKVNNKQQVISEKPEMIRSQVITSLEDEINYLIKLSESRKLRVLP